MRNRTDAYERYDPLLVEYHTLAAGDPRAAELRARLVDGFRPVARHIAVRFTGRREPVDDLEQVALIGLLHAIDRYDASRGEFLSYAIPTMMGEVRRHFRDATWTVRTPRDLKERYLKVGSAVGSLSQQMGRAPTAGELAEHLDLSADDVTEAMAAGSSYQPASLDRALDDTDGDALVDLLGTDDRRLDLVETRSVVRSLVADLPERERTLLVLRFVHERTQREIAAVLCISQMHVSRLLRRTLECLRERIDGDAGDTAAPTGTAA